MSIHARSRWQTPDEVFEALRQKGMLSQAAPFAPLVYSPPSTRSPTSVPPPSPLHEKGASSLSRSAEAIARFMQLSGSRCITARTSAFLAPPASPGSVPPGSLATPSSSAPPRAPSVPPPPARSVSVPPVPSTLPGASPASSASSSEPEPSTLRPSALLTSPVSQPASSQPAYSQPASSQPAYSQPASSQPASSQPASSQPAYSQPASSQPASSQPASSQPASSQPEPPEGMPAVISPSAPPTLPAAVQAVAVVSVSAPPPAPMPISSRPSASISSRPGSMPSVPPVMITVPPAPLLPSDLVSPGVARRPQLDCVLALLPGGAFLLAFGPEALDPAVASEVTIVTAAARELGGRVLVYYIEEPSEEPPKGTEIISLRASVEPFVREALRSHAETCITGWTEEDEARIVPALATTADGRELPVGEALEQAFSGGRRSVLLGDFGAGKSTQLLRRASAMAVGYLEDRTLGACPLMLPLRGMKPDLAEILREHVPGLSVEAFWLAAELGMVITFFDGIDEVSWPSSALLDAATSLTRFAENGRANLLLAASPGAFTGDAALTQLVRGAPPSAILTLPGLRCEDAKDLIRRAAGSLDAEGLVRAIDEVHPIEVFAARPGLLDLIAHRRRWLAPAGGPAAFAAVYGSAVRDWLRGDRTAGSGAPLDQRLLAGRALARALFGTSAESATPADIARASGAADPDAIRRAAEEMGSLPLFVRSEPEGALRFIHASFLDYFLAADISARLDEGREDALDVPALTPEIVGILTSIDGWSKRRKRLREILQQPYRRRVSENALITLYFAVRAVAEGERLGKKLTEELPCGAKLSGARLRGVSLAWASLPEADLSGADLSRADLTCADLRGARFDGAAADHVTFDGADLEWAAFDEADVFGASFVNANLAQVSWKDASVEGSVRIGARGGNGALISPGFDPGLDPVLRRVTESGPHMGQALAVSPDGRWLAVARGFTVAILDAVTGHVLRVLPGSTSCALAVAFSPDGRTLVAASKDGAVRVWDARRGSLVRTLNTEPAWVVSLAFSPDSETLVTASDNGPIRVWDGRRGDLLRTLEGRIAWFFSVAFSSDGDMVAAALADGTIRLWDARRGDVLRSIEGPAGPYMSLAFSPDGGVVATTSDDDGIRVIDPRGGDLLRVLSAATRVPGGGAPDAEAGAPSNSSGGGPEEPAAFTGPAMAVAFSASGELIASVGSDTGIQVWDARRGERVCFVDGSQGACAAAFPLFGETLYFTLMDGSIHAADARRGEHLRGFRARASTIDSAAFSPAGDTLACASAGGPIRVWDARRGDLLHTLSGPAAMGTQLAFSLDGDTLAAATVDGSIRLWDARRGELHRTLKDPGHHVTSLAFSVDGDTLASGAAEGTVALWDARSGALVGMLGEEGARIGAIAFAPEGAVLAAAGEDGPIRLWDAQAGEVLTVLHGHTAPVHSVVFLPDGSTLASASADGSIRLWDMQAGGLVRVVEGQTGPVHSLAFSPEGDLLASASADGTVRLWDAGAGELIGALEGHTASVSSVAFSLDGDMLITASADGSVRVWRAADGRCLCVLLAGDEAWVALVADAPFFVGGGDISSLLRFTAGSASMSASLWAPVFQRPDLVAKALWGDIPSPEAIGLGSVAACETALIEARGKLGLSGGRRDGPTAAVAVYKHSGPLTGITLSEDSVRATHERKLPMKRALTWIHLSDLHFGAAHRSEPQRFDQEAVMRAICRDVASSSVRPPDYIFVTGDIAWNGQPAEYEEAKAWLEEVVEAAGSSMDRLRLVPGNHDVDRSRANTKPVARAHSEIRAAPEELDNELSDAVLRGALADKLAAYMEFVRSVAPAHPAPGPNGLDWSERVAAVPAVRGRLRLAGLSTVWISDGSDGRLHKGQAFPFIRNMIVGERQMQQVFGNPEEDEMLFVLAHHPPEWLHRDSAEELAKALARRPHVHLCGHIHDAPQMPVQKRFGAAGSTVRYSAGAAHGDPAESRKHGYAWGALRWNPDASQWQAGWAPRIYDEEREMMRPDAARYTLDLEGFVWEPMRSAWRAPVTVEVRG